MTNHPPPDLADVWEDASTAPRRSPPSRRRGEAKPHRRKLTRRRRISALGYIGLALVCVCLAAAAFVLVAAPVDLVRERVIEQVKARTGRDLVVAGSTVFSLLPRPAIALSDVSLRAPEDAEGPPTLVVPVVEAELRLWSLLTTRPAVERITLHRPVIELTGDTLAPRAWRNRRSSAPPASSTGENADGGPAPAQSPAAETKTINKPRFGSGAVQIMDGTVRYRDQSTGTPTQIESVNLIVTADDPAGRIRTDGTLEFRGAKLTISSTVQELMAGRAAQLALKISGPLFEGSYDGSFAVGEGISLDGRVRLQAPSARALGDWLGRPLPAKDSVDAVALSGEIKAEQGRVALSNLQANLGPATMAGSLALDTKQRRLTGNLEISDLDFGRLLIKSRRAQAAAPSPPGSSAAQPADVSTSRQDRGRGWSEDPMDPSVLSLLNASLTLSARSIAYKDVKTGPGRLSVALEGGIGKVTLEEIELYGGRGRGLLTLDGTGEMLVTAMNLRLEGVALGPLLVDALHFPWLEGRGDIVMALAGQGMSERQIIETLNGKVDMTSPGGAITGLDMGNIVRGLQRARLPSFTGSPDEKTPFSELSGTFTVTNGIARNRDLKLVSPHLQLSGDGTLDLGPRQIDYTMRTKIGGGAPEPDASVKIGTIEVPISIVGPWEKPTFGIKGQEHLTGALKEIRKNLKSQDVRDALKSLLQGDSEKRVKPRDLIDKLLKKD